MYFSGLPQLNTTEISFQNICQEEIKTQEISLHLELFASKNVL